MKKLFVLFIFISGCSSVVVYPVGNFIDLSKKDLAKESKNLLKESRVQDDLVPSVEQKNDYYSGIVTNFDYRKYLLIECAMLLHKEYGLDYNKPVYATEPKWDNLQNWYAFIFNFQSTERTAITELTMECDLVIDRNKEVNEYQLKKSYRKLIKTE